MLSNDHPRQDWRAPENEEEKYNSDTVLLTPYTRNKEEFQFWRKMNGDVECDIPGCNKQKHDFQLRTKHRLMWSRRVEFLESIQTLDVDQIFLVNDAEGLEERTVLQHEDSAVHYYRFVNQIVDIIRTFDIRFPGTKKYFI